MSESDGPRPQTQELLHSITAVARAIFGAAASGIFLLNRASNDLVFEAVSGVGEDYLVGSTFPTMGALGWVVSSAEPIIIDDLVTNRQCADEIAGIIGYRPASMMAAPLLTAQEVLGLLVVLDPVPQSRSNLTDLELLALFADQSAIALRVVIADRGAGRGELRAGLLDELREFLSLHDSR